MKSTCNSYQILNEKQLIDSLKMNSAGKLFLTTHEDIKEIELDFPEDLQVHVSDDKSNK